MAEQEQKVIHISDEVHAKLKKHCKESKVKMKEFVTVLIDEAISKGPPKAKK